MPVDLAKLQELVTKKCREHFGAAVQDIYSAHGELNMVADREIVVPLSTFLRDDHDFRFDLLSYATAVDQSALKKEPRYMMAYMLYSTALKHRIRVKCGVPENDPTIDTVEGVWRTANWLERECFDMFGIIFKGHSDLRRILLPDDWQGHPLRKDFPLGGVKSFYFKRDTNPRAGEPETLVPRIREQRSDI